MKQAEHGPSLTTQRTCKREFLAQRRNGVAVCIALDNPKGRV